MNERAASFEEVRAFGHAAVTANDRKEWCRVPWGRISVFAFAALIALTLGFAVGRSSDGPTAVEPIELDATAREDETTEATVNDDDDGEGDGGDGSRHGGAATRGNGSRDARESADGRDGTREGDTDGGRGSRGNTDDGRDGTRDGDTDAGRGTATGVSAASGGGFSPVGTDDGFNGAGGGSASGGGDT
jgi:hypothetical protein